jgi:hypothetical protein
MNRVEKLTELQYSQERKGPFRLYVYEPNSEYHRGGIWFRNKVEYEGEEIPTATARELYANAMAAQREIRVTDSGDQLVHHCKQGKVLFGEKFWEEIS